MTVARTTLVDCQVTRYYHCISRCVRGAFLCGDGFTHRKQWIEDRLELLANQFAVSVCGFAVMDNHLHVLVRIDPQASLTWSDEEVVRRWLAVYPPRTLDMDDPACVKARIQAEIKQPKLIAEYRRRLQDLGWFMKALKEPLSRMANKEDKCKGAFWEGRLKSIAILDDEALLATCAYIDLNPVAAGIAATPETSRHTSVRQRVQHAQEQGQLAAIKQAAHGAVAGSRAAGKVEQSHWLCPVQDARRQGAGREGMLESFSLGSYLLLVDYTGRLFRQGKARISSEIAGILERLGSSGEVWNARLQKMLTKSRWLGSYFATGKERLQMLARQRGVHHLDNAVPLNG